MRQQWIKEHLYLKKKKKMKGGHHIKFTQYFKILTLNRGERSFYFLFLFNNKIPLDSS